jgi:hypothetical protein
VRDVETIDEACKAVNPQQLVLITIDPKQLHDSCVKHQPQTQKRGGGWCKDCGLYRTLTVAAECC